MSATTKRDVEHQVCTKTCKGPLVPTKSPNTGQRMQSLTRAQRRGLRWNPKESTYAITRIYVVTLSWQGILANSSCLSSTPPNRSAQTSSPSSFGSTRGLARCPLSSLPTSSFIPWKHPETLWLKTFTSYLLSHHPASSLIRLHDGIWLTPAPPPSLVVTANLHATAALNLGESVKTT